MWAMLQQDAPRDYVIATGATHSVRDFLDLAFRHVGLDYREHLVVDKTFYRPAEVHVLCGNASRARRELGWEPKVDFETLVREMVDHDMALFAAGGPPEMREVAL
jgi:GDPmannose 4,6-dehydratase